MRRLLIIRPEPGASATTAKAREMGLDAMSVPLFAVQPLTWGAIEPADYRGIVATSANAFRHGGKQLESLRALPVHAVGEATAEAAREAGFEVATVGEGGRIELGERLPAGRLLHLAGADHLAVEAAEAVAVYANIAIDPPPAIDVAEAVVMVHSPRAGRRLADLVQERGRTVIAAISDKAVQACGPGWERMAVASMPREPALLALAAKLCQNEGR
ncbi:uroporphyrinogen-III synthase [Sphingomonas sp. HDW15A]|uniref:uroporphyrinogen-III synthase n=1 Tax=Sphingomonas sp. HDW15A TaxID=2714942 RepID=UPI00140C3259|nr:uroporphyrinogen-III synthase [Sphingomonas sp. HDW15A]QIK96944.1 uroporphyrinogen-III synthase [Sphingomonas sp. HDW15A]